MFAADAVRLWKKVRKCGLKLSRDGRRRTKRKPPRKGDVWRFKVSVLRASGAAGMEYLRIRVNRRTSASACEGHIRRLEWKTRYDESAKLFDENLQNS